MSVEPHGGDPLAAPEGLPSQPLDPIERLFREHDVPPDLQTEIRQVIQQFPPAAQMLFVREWQKGREYADTHPNTPTEYPISTAWKGLKAQYEMTEAGWVPKKTGIPTTAAKLGVVVTEEDGKFIVTVPGVGEHEYESHTFDPASFGPHKGREIAKERADELASRLRTEIAEDRARLDLSDVSDQSEAERVVVERRKYRETPAPDWKPRTVEEMYPSRPAQEHVEPFSDSLEMGPDAAFPRLEPEGDHWVLVNREIAEHGGGDPLFRWKRTPFKTEQEAHVALQKAKGFAKSRPLSEIPPAPSWSPPAYEAPSGQPYAKPKHTAHSDRIVRRLLELSKKMVSGQDAESESNVSAEARQEVAALIQEFVAGGYEMHPEDWRTLSEGAFPGLNTLVKQPGERVKPRTPVDEFAVTAPLTPMYEALIEGLRVPGYLKTLENPAATRQEKDQAERSLFRLFEKSPNLRQVVREWQEKRRAPKKSSPESGRYPVSEVAEITQAASMTDVQWGRAVRVFVRGMREVLESASEVERIQARECVSQLVSTASLGSTLNTIAGERFIAAIEGVRIMPRTAKVQFDAKAGKFNVLHASLIKPLVFASQEEADKVARSMDGGTDPQVTKTGDAFQVSHPDWERPVAARTAADAQTVVEQKLLDLGDGADEAKARAQEITQKANEANEATPSAEVKPADGAPAVKPEEENKPQEVTAAVNIQADTKQTPKGTVSGFPNTNVSAPAGKHPNIPGSVVGPEKPAVAALDAGKTPDAEQLKSDNKASFDKEVAKVNRAHGLLRTQEKLLMSCSAEELAIVERKVTEAKAEIAAARAASAAK